MQPKSFGLSQPKQSTLRGENCEGHMIQKAVNVSPTHTKQSLGLCRDVSMAAFSFVLASCALARLHGAVPEFEIQTVL